METDESIGRWPRAPYELQERLPFQFTSRVRTGKKKASKGNPLSRMPRRKIRKRKQWREDASYVDTSMASATPGDVELGEVGVSGGGAIDGVAPFLLAW